MEVQYDNPKTQSTPEQPVSDPEQRLSVDALGRGADGRDNAAGVAR
jgi:hypothetical protein